jgi:DNA-binding LytR/AlgR family response regulator
MIHCLIVDDEPLAQDILETYISRNRQLVLVKKCSNAIEAFSILHAEKVDLVFLDIKMPGINGIDFVRSLKNAPALIFTTAFAHHAVEGFELDAVDYLLKPITYERFSKAIDKLLRIQRTEPEVKKEYTYFKVSGRLVRILHKEIRYARSVKDYIQLHTTTGNHLIHMTMKYLAELLPAEIFVRVHRSFLVNKNAVESIEKDNIRIGNEMIPVGENYRSNRSQFMD